MQNELNTSLIEAVKEKLPLKENLANLLIDTLYIGNTGYYIRLLENNSSKQTNNLGIMRPTLDSIMQTYKVDLPRLYKEG